MLQRLKKNWQVFVAIALLSFSLGLITSLQCDRQAVNPCIQEETYCDPSLPTGTPPLDERKSSDSSWLILIPILISH